MVNVGSYDESEDALQLSSSPPLTLAADTAALLAQFFTEKTDKEQELRSFIEPQDAPEATCDAEPAAPRCISPEKFTQLWTEDWQLSQFWYTPDFSKALAKALALEPATSIAFLCCPTAYVAYRHAYPAQARCSLLECDPRFRAFARDEFVRYDLNEPDNLPTDLLGSVDLAVVDPPFLNEVTNRLLAQSLRTLLKPKGRLVLITSPSVESLPRIYDQAPLGPLRRSPLTVQHAGLRNDFVCWTSWAGGERFGA